MNVNQNSVLSLFCLCDCVQSRERVMMNDLLNAQLILEKGRHKVHRFIRSQYDPKLEKYTGSNLILK
jgi:hypothetical protein